MLGWMVDGGWRMAKMDGRIRTPGQNASGVYLVPWKRLSFLGISRHAVWLACPSVRSTSARGTYCSDVVGDGYLGTEYISKVPT